MATVVSTMAALVWLVTVASGIALLSAHAAAPGTPADPPRRWPSASAVVRRAGTPTVLVFAHPGCPCTRATLGEIDWVLAHVEGGADVHVLLLQPEGGGRAWSDTSLAEIAATIPTVQVHRDAGGDEASRFGVATSGEVLLYDGGGALRFAGGITGARGHAGANAGRDELLLRLTTAAAEQGAAPVFGCGLWSPPAT